MMNWLVRLWRRIERMMHREAVQPTYYRPSNLHGRRR
jgi:hypothetical protein